MLRTWLVLTTVLSPIVALAQPTEPAPVEPPPESEPVESPPQPTPPPIEPLPQPAPKAEPAPKVETTKHVAATPWYDKLSVRGYVQVRFNRLYTTEDEFRNDLGDKQLAEDNTFSIRRARLIVSGDITPVLSMYIQVDGAGADVKMRDWYGDIFASKERELWVRAGQSKVPFGWENMQSSSNRAPLDRSDPINSAAPGERDLGVFVYWAPAHVRKRFKHLVDNLKGSGDFGVLALGAYLGQTLNTDDKNDNVHVVARATYPFELGNQILEVGAAGYAGKFTVERDMTIMGGDAVRDARVGGTIVLYPQPIGFQAEWNIGRGPELVVDTIKARTLHGGYAMVIGRVGPFVPYARLAYYEGGIKTIKNAPLHESKELAVGSEWHITKRVELTLEMDHAKRAVGDTEFRGTIFRTQLLLSY